MAPDFFNWIKRNLNALVLAFICFLAFVVFEAFQQVFYSKNFNNGAAIDYGFWDVLQGGVYRWTIWSAIAVPFGAIIYRMPKSVFNIRKFFLHAGLIIVALLSNLVVITLLNSAVQASWGNFTEVFEFYFFHKAPIIFVALIFLTLMVYYFKGLEVLELTISQVGQLKRTNRELFKELEKGQLPEESLVFEIRTGNRVKLLPESNILWIEADDYCVKVYDLEGGVHTLRSSLKAFEEKLPGQKFLRVHRKAIINLSYVKGYELGDEPVAVLTNDQEVSIAQSRLKHFRNVLQPA